MRFRRKKKAEKVVDFAISMFDGMTDEQVEEFNEQCDRETRARHAEYLEEHAQMQANGEPEDLDLRYLIYMNAVQIRNNEKVKVWPPIPLDYILTREQFDKLCGGSHE